MPPKPEKKEKKPSAKVEKVVIKPSLSDLPFEFREDVLKCYLENFDRITAASNVSKGYINSELAASYFCDRVYEPNFKRSRIVGTIIPLILSSERRRYRDVLKIRKTSGTEAAKAAYDLFVVAESVFSKELEFQAKNEVQETPLPEYVDSENVEPSSDTSSIKSKDKLKKNKNEDILLAIQSTINRSCTSFDQLSNGLLELINLEKQEIIERQVKKFKENHENEK
eukprot:NODE_361_length_8796_cov_0.460274.p4 type:complete len:225 gc:universal NODE_361_length_8796_cov_0.460274:252-926(+)